MLLFIFALQGKSYAQSLPVGTPVLEDAYRRAQLLGQMDSSVSLMVRPMFPVESFGLNNVFDPTGELHKERWTKTDGIFQAAGVPGKIQLLPFTIQQQYNTHHPYSLNDGAMIPARGYQTLVSGGFFAQYGPLSIQFRPEYVYAENRDYQGFYKELSDQKWYEYYQVVTFIDLPERFGTTAYEKLNWGQSSIRLNYGPASIGFSNENLWWGPGMRNSLVMSNTADGFWHYTLNTTKPVRTPIGSFEGQIIAGRLVNSGYDVPDINRTFLGYSIYLPKRDEPRYINAMVMSYQPKWIPGLFLGFTRSFTKYDTDKDKNFESLFPVFFPLEKKYDPKNPGKLTSADQRASVFIRWLCKPENAEVYFEFMREDNSPNWNDFFLQMEYSRAYLFGLNKLMKLNHHPGQYIQVNLELTQLEQTNANPTALYRYLYTSHDIRQGYTHNGQLLGAAIGPGSNLQSLSVSWLSGLKKIGIQFERYVHNNDFHNIGIKDFRANWVDLSATAMADWNWKNLLFSLKIENILSFNYEHRYQSRNPDSGQFMEPGINYFNLQGNLGLSYRF